MRALEVPPAAFCASITMAGLTRAPARGLEDCLHAHNVGRPARRSSSRNGRPPAATAKALLGGAGSSGSGAPAGSNNDVQKLQSFMSGSAPAEQGPSTADLQRYHEVQVSLPPPVPQEWVQSRGRRHLRRRRPQVEVSELEEYSQQPALQYQQAATQQRVAMEPQQQKHTAQQQVPQQQQRRQAPAQQQQQPRRPRQQSISLPKAALRAAGKQLQAAGQLLQSAGERLQLVDSSPPPPVPRQRQAQSQAPAGRQQVPQQQKEQQAGSMVEGKRARAAAAFQDQPASLQQFTVSKLTNLRKTAEQSQQLLPALKPQSVVSQPAAARTSQQQQRRKQAAQSQRGAQQRRQQQQGKAQPAQHKGQHLAPPPAKRQRAEQAKQVVAGQAGAGVMAAGEAGSPSGLLLWAWAVPMAAAVLAVAVLRRLRGQLSWRSSHDRAQQEIREAEQRARSARLLDRQKQRFARALMAAEDLESEQGSTDSNTFAAVSRKGSAGTAGGVGGSNGGSVQELPGGRAGADAGLGPETEGKPLGHEVVPDLAATPHHKLANGAAVGHVNGTALELVKAAASSHAAHSAANGNGAALNGNGAALNGNGASSSANGADATNHFLHGLDTDSDSASAAAAVAFGAELAAAAADMDAADLAAAPTTIVDEEDEFSDDVYDPSGWDEEIRKQWDAFVSTSKVNKGKLWDSSLVDEGLPEVWVDLNR